MMADFWKFLSETNAPGILLAFIALIVLSVRKSGWVGEFINALNSLNTPWIAIIVVVLGMLYNLKCKQYGLAADSANQVIGGGLGLLTGQALAARRLEDHSSNPTTPVTPAQPK